MPIDIPRVHSIETCPLEGYEALQVRVLANTSDAEWKRWMQSNLGMPDCEACKKLAEQPVRRGKKAAAVQPAEEPRLYCPACQAARVAYGECDRAALWAGAAGRGWSRRQRPRWRCSTVTTRCPARS